MLLYNTCFENARSSSLRKQLLVRFGIVSVIAALLVIVAACACFAIMANNSIQEPSISLFKSQVTDKVVENSKHIAELFRDYSDSAESTINLLHEIVSDRIVGYPYEGWEDDLFVPFPDMDHPGTNKYPIMQSNVLSLDWAFESNINEANKYEHLQERADIWWSITSSPNNTADNNDSSTHQRYRRSISTATSSYFMQGTCDPNVTDVTSPVFYPDCLDAANNNIESGGIVQPTLTNAGLYKKSADISVLLKPIYESSPDVVQVAIYYFNSGAGSVLQYPASTLRFAVDSEIDLRCKVDTTANTNDNGANYSKLIDSEYNSRRNRQLSCRNVVDSESIQPATNYTSNDATYISYGCEWMRMINPKTNRSFGTEEEVKRCHPADTTVTEREFNPNEFFWFQDAVILGSLQSTSFNRSKVSWWVPKDRPFSGGSSALLFQLARVVFDKKTNEIIGCVATSLAFDHVANMMHRYKMDHSDVAIINIEHGMIITDTLNISSDKPGSTVNESSFITHTDYEILLKRLHEVSSSWTVDDGERVSKETTLYSDKYLYTLYPLNQEEQNDTIGECVLFRISYDVYDDLLKAGNGVQHDLLQVIISVSAMGLVGLAFTLVFVWFVARWLTRPLLWMERVSWSITNHDSNNTDISFSSYDTHTKPNDPIKPTEACSKSISWIKNFTLKTEVTELVAEFHKMITGFSGTGASHIAEADLHELKNMVTWQSDFQKLYTRTNSRMDENTFLPRTKSSETLEVDNKDTHNFDIDTDLRVPDQVGTRASHCFLSASMNRNYEGSTYRGNSGMPCVSTAIVPLSSTKAYTICPAPPKLHFGVNEKNIVDRLQLQQEFDRLQVKPWKSRLFWSIIAFIVFPLAIATLSIGYKVAAKLECTSDYWLDTMKQESVLFEIDTLRTITLTKANHFYIVLESVISDLHLLTRTAGWFHFGAINRSESFSQLDVGSQECRTYPPDGDLSCPIVESIFSECTCEWKNLINSTCKSEVENIRSKQQRHIFGQERDANKDTGRRQEAESFGVKGIDDSPANTIWWSNISETPGAYKRGNASGYATTYDRVRVSSAMSVVEIPVYNYGNLRRHVFGTMVAFDADGVGTGYRGCKPSYLHYASFLSTESNNASGIAPKLCPQGKFGYDPRCRSWYSRGKTIYESNRHTLHITAPYEFALSDIVGATATSPLVNPYTNEYIGQILLDFKPYFSHVLGSLDDSVSFLISIDSDVEEDTVIGPDGESPLNPIAIGDLLLPFDDKNSDHRKAFDTEILPKIKTMALHHNGTWDFRRTSATNSLAENLTIACSNIDVRGLRPIHPADFSRGVEVESFPVYSVCIALTAVSINEPWDKIYVDVVNSASRFVIIYFVVIFVISILYLASVFMITWEITEPMITLLYIVQKINEGQFDRDVPPLHGGSREVHQVYASFAKLIKTIRMSNVTYFSGDLTWSYQFTSDALKLFRKIGDEKAMGIASSNIGNTLHAMYHNAVYSNDCCNMIPNMCCLKSAIMHYDEAIEIAERHVQYAAKNKAEFELQLADRLFNRGLFLLLVYNEACAPVDAKSRALDDLTRVRDIDNRVKEFFLLNKLLYKQSADHFCRLLRRCFGLLEFYCDEELRHVWDLEYLIKEADSILVVSWDDPSSPLFYDVSREGRLQQLQSIVIRHELCKGRYFEAASLGVRMFVEDEYLIEDSFKMATTALLEFMKDDASDCWSGETKTLVRSDLRRMLRKRKGIDVDVGKCIVFALELSQNVSGQQLLDEINNNCLSFYDDCCYGDDIVGLVANSSNTENLNLQLGVKSDNEGIQRTSLDIATTSTSDSVYHTTPFAIQMIIDSTVTKEIDSFILMITDGFSFDAQVMRSLRSQIERLNEDRETQTHIFILGLDINDEDVVNEYKMVCNASKISLYLDVTCSNIESAFDTVRNLIRGPVIGNSCNKGLTMERF